MQFHVPKLSWWFHIRKPSSATSILLNSDPFRRDRVTHLLRHTTRITVRLLTSVTFNQGFSFKVCCWPRWTNTRVLAYGRIDRWSVTRAFDMNRLSTVHPCWRPDNLVIRSLSVSRSEPDRPKFCSKTSSWWVNYLADNMHITLINNVFI